MKQTKFLLSVFMAIVMMAMSPTKVWADDVASVTIDGTTIGYDNIQTAVTAAMDADEATMTLLANIDLGGGFITFSKGNVTLDLNGKKLAAQAVNDIIVDGGSLTITDNSEGKTGSVPANASSLEVKSGSITIHAGTFSSQQGACLNIQQGVTAKIDGGRFYTTRENSNAIFTSVAALASGYAYYITGTNTQIVPNEYGEIPAKDITVKKVEESPAAEDAVSVTINGTTTGYADFATALTAAKAAESATIKLLQGVNISSITSFAQGNITLDLNGKTIQNQKGSAMAVNGASLTIIDSSEEQTGKVQSSGGMYSTTISANSGSLTIYAGTFDSSSMAALSVSKAYDSDVMPNVKLYGGHFISPTYAIYTEDPNILTSGKAFYDADDNILTEIAEYGHLLGTDGYSALDVTVKDAPVASVTIDGTTTGYNNIQDAFSAALNAESATIKILADVTISSTLVVSKENCNVTLDLNGHTIHSVGPNTLNLSNGELTIKDSSGDNSGTMSTSGSYALYVTGGTITIHGGTFSASGNALNVTGGTLTIHGGTFSASGYALDITSPTVTATIDGGIFKATGGSGINNKSGKSILANGYAFCNSDGDELLEIKDDFIREGNFPAHYIIVKQATIKATLTIGSETKEYPNFNSAFNAALEADAAILKVMQDVDTYAGTAYENPWIVNKGNVILDLNGHTMYASQGYSVIKVTGGTLTILDSNEDKLGKMTTTGGSTIDATGGSITIKDGTFTTEQGRPFSLTGSATASLEGGRFISYNNVEAVVSGCGSPLAEGYSYYNATTGVKLTTTASTKENGQNVSEVIVRANATVINDGAFTCPVSYTPESVTFTRTITKDGGKYSFIVPFDIPAAKASTLGKFYKFEKYENETVYFAQETDVKANTAYFFEPASSITSISLNNAEVKATTSMADASNPSNYGLYGTYKKIAAPEGAYGYATSAEGEDKFVRAGTGSYVNAFRCYLWLGNSDSAPAKANAIFGFDEATGINATKADYLDLNAPMYNLRGQRITSPQKGEIYIMGGKKVIFK